MRQKDELIRAAAAREWNEARLWSYPNVTAIGVSRRRVGGVATDELAVQVRVGRKLAPGRVPAGAMLPREVAGPDGDRLPVDVVESGPFVGASGTVEHRPVIGGISLGREVTLDYSTLGGVVCDLTDNSPVLLSCNHAIANLDSAPPTTGIVQPARAHGGMVPSKLIGELKRYSPIAISPSPPPTSPVDAAIGTLTEPWDLEVRDIGPGVFELGTANLGDVVQKSGAITDVTQGTVDTVSATVDVDLVYYASPGLVWKRAKIGNSFFVDASATFCSFGDSGSLVFSETVGVVDGTFPCVGLLYAYDANDDSIGICNDISAVFSALQLTTLCDCVAKAIFSFAFGPAPVGGGGKGAGGRPFPDAGKKAADLRRFRDRLMATTPLGREVVKFVEKKAAVLSTILIRDTEAFGLAVRAFRPWVRLDTDLDLLEAPIDAQTVDRLQRLADCLSDREPTLKPQLSMMKAALTLARGATLKDLLRAAAPTPSFTGTGTPAPTKP